MHGLIVKITITQVSTTKYPNRDKFFVFDFGNEITINSTWANLTDTMQITMPRRLYFLDASTGEKTTWDKMQVYGNPEKAPLILRGDKIKVEFGYSDFKTTSPNSFNRSIIVENMATRFEGYITKINNKTPLELECEDNMYALKQTLVENKEWTSEQYTTEQMLQEMLSKSTFSDVKNFTLLNKDNYKTKLGKFITYNVTMAQVLDELRKQPYNLQSFFRGNSLHWGVIRYYFDEKVNHQFHFQKNIISDNLIYTRADDMRIGVVAKSINNITLNETNANGTKKTRHKEIKVSVGDKDGEIRTLFFTDLNEDELKKAAEAKLPYLKYEGFRGSFTTFCMPHVKHGDTVQLIDEVLPERDGTYLVKDVKYGAGMNGGRQTITLDIRVDGLAPDQLEAFQSNGL
jgi:hypothetical protein